MSSDRILAIDARLAGSSGIGTYIGELVPRLALRLPSVRLVLLGDPARLARLAEKSGAGVRECTSRVYSLSEQLDVVRAIPGGASALWCPHYVVPFLWRGPLAVTVHDVLHLRMPELFGGRLKQLLVRAMFARVRRKARLIMADSTFTASEFMSLVGAPRGALNVIPLGVDEAWFSPSPPARRGRPFMLYVGNVKPHKNLVRLLHAFSRVATSLPHDLLVVGRREGFLTGDPGVEQAASALGDRVQFTGAVSDGALRELYAGADALLFPSLYEGFGFPPLEAMATGIPVMAGRAASLPEVCGDAVRWVDPLDVDSIVDGIRAVATDEALRSRLVAAGRERAATFRWDATADLTAAALAPLLGTTVTPLPAPARAFPSGSIP